MRVLVVDDSAVDRRLLVHLLESDPDLEVVGEAKDGFEAVRLARQLGPDVITMDLNMPGLNGFETTTRIMEERPTPIVIVGARIEGPERAFKALNAGALTLIQKPVGPRSPDFDDAARDLVTTVKLMAEVKLVSRRRNNIGRRIDMGPSRRSPARSIELIAIGASTGGPAALATILSELPSDLPAPIVIVQHIVRGFEKGLADWLGRVSNFDVRVATHHQELRPGRVLIAPHAHHLGVSRHGRAVLGGGEPIAGQVPSATFLLRSVAAEYGSRAMGVILTGMGSDGRDGALELKTAGGFVVAQDADSSVVFGMPAETVAAGAADRVLPLTEMADFISRACHGGS